MLQQDALIEGTKVRDWPEEAVFLEDEEVKRVDALALVVRGHSF